MNFRHIKNVTSVFVFSGLLYNSKINKKSAIFSKNKYSHGKILKYLDFTNIFAFIYVLKFDIVIINVFININNKFNFFNVLYSVFTFHHCHTKFKSLQKPLFLKSY